MAPGGPADKKNNVLPLWGNEKTMNLNNLILTNILSSPYFKVNLYKLKTYHEVVDEIYYNVQHLEPWEKGSRKTSGQTGMCGGVRGVGAGGIVSTAFCILYKLFTLKLTRKQLLGLMNHCDSPYIRALGFMYIRFTQPPADLVDWYEPYLDDDEELDVKAGGGQMLRIGDMLRHLLTKLEWFATLFPRIPVPIQKEIERRLAMHPPKVAAAVQEAEPEAGPAASTAAAADGRALSPEPRRRRSPYARDPSSGRDTPRDSSWDRDRQRARRSRSRERHREHHHRSRSPRDGRLHRTHDRPPRDERGREGHSREERVRDDRSRDERPRDERLRDDRSRDDRPRDDRSHDRSRDDRSRNDRPRDERSREDRSRDDKLRGDRSRDDRIRAEKPREPDRYESGSHRHRGSPERSRHRERSGESSMYDYRGSSRKERSYSPVARNHHR
ncbi:uncharacterized protein LOC144153351 isoform X2 [Haemaphysalis longicornis]